jgi:hypothetical protein
MYGLPNTGIEQAGFSEISRQVSGTGCYKFTGAIRKQVPKPFLFGSNEGVKVYPKAITNGLQKLFATDIPRPEHIIGLKNQAIVQINLAICIQALKRELNNILCQNFIGDLKNGAVFPVRQANRLYLRSIPMNCGVVGNLIANKFG